MTGSPWKGLQPPGPARRVIVCIFARFVISLLPFSTRQDPLQELHRKLQSLEERLEEELLKTGKALRKDFREDTKRWIDWGDDCVSATESIQTSANLRCLIKIRVPKRVDPSIPVETTSRPLVKERLGRLS